jgi:nitrogen regulatory protein PII-like uncharacterized protein
LNKSLTTGNPEVTLALIEELVERGALYTAVGNRSEEELIQLIDFLKWKVNDHRYGPVLVEVLRITIDMYTGVFGLSSVVDGKFKEMS